MRRLTIAVLAPGWSAGTGLSAAEVGSNPVGFPFWKPVGQWVVLLLPLGEGGFSCTALTRSPPAGPVRYSMGFALTLSATHFYLRDDALPDSVPGEIALRVDEQPVTRLKVLLHEPLKGGALNGGKEQMLMADLPGDLLARQVFPAMVRGQTLDVIIGDRDYAMPIAGFESVIVDLRQCARLALGTEPQVASRSRVDRN